MIRESDFFFHSIIRGPLNRLTDEWETLVNEKGRACMLRTHSELTGERTNLSRMNTSFRRS